MRHEVRNVFGGISVLILLAATGAETEYLKGDFSSPTAPSIQEPPHVSEVHKAGLVTGMQEATFANYYLVIFSSGFGLKRETIGSDIWGGFKGSTQLPITVRENPSSSIGSFNFGQRHCIVDFRDVTPTTDKNQSPNLICK